MNKQIRKLLKRSFLVFLFLGTLLLFIVPTPVLLSDVEVVKDVSNDVNQIMDEDFYLFCLANLQQPNESVITYESQDDNSKISTQPS